MPSQKPEWPCLFQAHGPQKLSVHQLKQLVEKTPGHRRVDLWNSFSAFIGRLLEADLYGLDLWVDGSFTTGKPTPKDVDCVLWLPQSHISSCSDNQYAELVSLRNRPEVRLRYGVDLYLAPPEEPQNIAYWSRCFGTRYDNITPKGFAVVTL
jgi:hypothetical protein